MSEYSKEVRKRLMSMWMSELGSEGGKTTGKTKRRGSSEYYKALSAKAAKARKQK